MTETNLEQIQSAINPEMLKAFHLMWDEFPSQALLVTKDRTVVACNHAATKRGFQPGMKCFQLSTDRVHKHCLAIPALEQGTGQQTVVYSPVTKKVYNSIWVPLAGEKNLFVHTVLDISSYAKPELFQP